jgi:hypothetical protein
MLLEKGREPVHGDGTPGASTAMTIVVGLGLTSHPRTGDSRRD